MLDGFDVRSDLATSDLHSVSGDRPAHAAHPNDAYADDGLAAALRELSLSSRRLLAAVRADRVRAEELSMARRIVRDLDLALRLAPSPPTLALAGDGSWFELGDERVDLSRRCSVRRILGALVAERRAGSTRALDVHELFAVGWPGERIPYESQVRRVYTAVWTLRRMGLDATLLTRDGGYLLDPKQGIVFDDA